MNIKILLDGAVRAGRAHASPTATTLLEAMTDEVAALVLRDNYRQNRALDNAQAQAAEMEDVHARFIRALEQPAHLDRAVERLPDDETARRPPQRRASASPCPSSPCCSPTPRSRSKKSCSRAALPDDPDFVPELVRYFPHRAARALPRPHPRRTRCGARSSRPRS